MFRDSPASPALARPAPAEDPEFLSRQLVTCLGNKRALLPLLGRALGEVKHRLGAPRLRIADLFAGSGVVARFFKAHASHLVANDLEPFSHAVNACHLTNRSDPAADPATLAATLRDLEAAIRADWRPGFIAELYAPRDDAAIAPGERVFYTRRNAIYLDTARRALEALPPAQRRLFLGPLLAAASVHANTAGVFKGFYKRADGTGQFGGHGRDALARIMGEIHLAPPVLSRCECPCEVHQADAATLADALPPVDLVYLDPPYNQHPYGSNYFMLNLLVDYRRPAAVSRVSGIPGDWRRSVFNRRAAAAPALFDLVARCRAKFVLLSYNSEGFIPPAEFRRALAQCGRVEVMETPHPTFRGSRNLHARAKRVTEFLYLVDKR